MSGGPFGAAAAPRGVERRLVVLMWPFRWWILAGVALGCLAIGSAIGLIAVSAYLISQAALITNVAEVALVVTAVRVLAIARAVFRYLERYVTHRATLRILAHLRAAFFEAIEPLAPARLGAHRSGDLLGRIVRDVDTLEDFYVRAVLPPLVAAVVTAVVSLVLGAFEPILGVVLLAFLLVTGVVLPVGSRRLSRRASAEVIAARGLLDAVAVDAIEGMAELVVFDQQGRQRAAQLALGERLYAAQERLALLRGLGAALGGLLATLAGLALLAMAVPLVTGGRLEGVFLAAIPLAAIASFEAVISLTPALQALDSSRAAAARLLELIDAPAEVVDPPTPAARPTSAGIRVEGLRFRYAADAPDVLEGLDLDIPAGASLGLIGPSGSGKSTLVSLLLRFHEATAGRITIGGRDVRQLSADDVRAMIGLVPQHVDLFDASVRDNLALADPELTDEAMVEACRRAQLHEVIGAWPLGYDTRIGEDGRALSGGERQRLAIARVLIRAAPVLILDEATSQLDADTEARVLDELAGFMQGRTTLLISHRPDVVARADRVLRLEAGAAAGEGRSDGSRSPLGRSA